MLKSAKSALWTGCILASTILWSGCDSLNSESASESRVVSNTPLAADAQAALKSLCNSTPGAAALLKEA